MALLRTPDNYTSCYCEENIYRVSLQSPEFVVEPCYAVLITNPGLTVQVDHSASSPSGSVVWDYHVILLTSYTPDGGAPPPSGTSTLRVLDYDTLLPLLCPLDAYLSATFPSTTPPSLRPVFRVVPYQTYLSYFSSDRRHMRVGERGGYTSPPPTWPLIKGTAAPTAHTLAALLDVSSSSSSTTTTAIPGELHTVESLQEWASVMPLNSRFSATMALFETALAQESPRNEPYKSAYQGRALLEGFVKELEGGGEGAGEMGVSISSSSSSPSSITLLQRTRDVLALCYVKLGQNYVDTEETQVGESHLVYALPWLVSRVMGGKGEGEGGGEGEFAKSSTAAAATAIKSSTFSCTSPLPGCQAPHPLCLTPPFSPSSTPTSPPLPATQLPLVLSAMDALSHLALLYSGWDNHPKALRALRLSKALHRRCVVPSPSPSLPSHQVAALDTHLTRLCFYLTQVYGHLGCAGVAARYIERLLCRQLGGGGEGELDRLEWARNAMRLGSYHVQGGNWGGAGACFTSAQAMVRVLEGEERGKGSKNSGGGGSAKVGVETPGEASELLASPIETGGGGGDGGGVNDVGSTGMEFPLLGDSFYRVKAESSMHWGQFYEALLRVGVEGSSSSSSSSEEGSSVGGKGSAATTQSSEPLDTASSDPFSTLPVVDFGRAGNGGGGKGGDGPLRGVGTPDVISVDDSDHDADICVISREGGGGGEGGGRGGNLVTLTAKYLVDPSHPTPTPTPTPTPILTPPTDFPTARAVFLLAQSAYQSALQYFVLDGFVTEYRGATEGLAECWRHLAHFEGDVKRVGAMHARRGGLLVALGKELNFGVYKDTVRALVWGGGMAWVEAMDARSRAMETAGSPPGGGGTTSHKGVNEACDCALEAMTLYLRGYSDPRFPGQPLGGSNAPLPPLEGASTTIPVEEEEQWALGHFFSARALFRRCRGGVEERREDVKRCLDRAAWYLQAVKKLDPACGVRLKECTRLAEELVTLLPQKLAIL